MNRLLRGLPGLVVVKRTEGTSNSRIRDTNMATPTPNETGYIYNWQRLEKKDHRQQVLDICPRFSDQMFATKFGMSESPTGR
jgi:hypothetical protein